MDRGAQGGQRPLQRCHLGAAVVGFAVPVIAVGGEQDYRVELREPGGRSVCSVVLRAGRPDRADAGGGQERDQGRRGVRQVADDPVATPHPVSRSHRASAATWFSQLGPRGPRRGAVLADGGERHGVVLAMAQGVFSVVEPGSGEPAGSGHGGVGEHLGVAAVSGDVEEVPHGAPELLELADGPSVQVQVGAELGPGPPGHVAAEPGDGRAGRRLGARTPDGFPAWRGWVRGHAGQRPLWAPVIMAARSSGCRNDGGGGGPQAYRPCAPSRSSGVHSWSSMMQSMSL